jgi:hypothetical protein
VYAGKSLICREDIAMKAFARLVIDVVAAMLLIACPWSNSIYIGWEVQINPGYTSSITQWFDGHSTIELEGKATLTKGTLAASVTDPAGKLVWAHAFTEGSTIVILQQFEPVIGDWLMDASSADGEGTLSLHLYQKR